jgi:hypothetical protein
MRRRHFLNSAGAVVLLPGFALAQGKYPTKPCP